MNKLFICTKNMFILFSLLSRLEPTQATQNGNIDLPDIRHIWNYLDATEKMLDLCTTFRHGTNPNIYFAIFLVNVNLKEILQKRENLLPKRLKDNLVSLLRKSTRLSKQLKERETRKKIKRLYTLFSNESSWISRIKDYKFAIREHQPGNKQRLQRKFQAWHQNLLASTTATHRPDNPNACVLNLALTPEKSFGSAVTQCRIIGQYCRKAVLLLYDYGFGLCARLLFLLLARYGRGCSVFISVIDDDLSKRICEVSYAETEYLINNGENFNMMIDKITLCSLNGHPEFLQVPWLTHIMDVLSTNGCTSTRDGVTRRHLRKAVQHSQRQKGDAKKEICSEDIIAAAAAIFASAVRYIAASHYV